MECPTVSKRFFLPIMYGFLCGITLAETVRHPMSIPLYPDRFKLVLTTTEENDVYFSITLPATSMFWLKCLVKLYQSMSKCNSSKKTSKNMKLFID